MRGEGGGEIGNSLLRMLEGHKDLHLSVLDPIQMDTSNPESSCNTGSTCRSEGKMIKSESGQQRRALLPNEYSHCVRVHGEQQGQGKARERTTHDALASETLTLCRSKSSRKR